jgi:hypothetical protein
MRFRAGQEYDHEFQHVHVGGQNHHQNPAAVVERSGHVQSSVVVISFLPTEYRHAALTA